MLKPSRACDRCHSVKERCRRTPGSDTCERCSRLSYSCETKRPLIPSGRKPKSQRRDPFVTVADPIVRQETDNTEAASIAISSQHDMELDPAQYTSEAAAAFTLQNWALTVPQEAEIEALEWCLLSRYLGNKAMLGCFTIGPSFHDAHQQAMYEGLSASFPQLKDAFLSWSSLYAHEVKAHKDTIRHACHQRAAYAIAELRSIQAVDRAEATTCLLLGLVLITFAMFSAGGEVQTLCRSVLSHLAPFYERGDDFGEGDLSYLLCIVCIDVFECLLRGEMPSLLIRKHNGQIIDQYIGLCRPMLHYSCRLAELNSHLPATNSDYERSYALELSRLEHELTEWQPEPPDDFIGHFQRAEVVNMLAQVKIFRSALLLIIHRLRYPYGSQTGQARLLRQIIISEADLAFSLTEKEIPGAAVSLMVAAFEAQDESEQQSSIEQMKILAKFCPLYQERLTRQLQSFWSARRDNPNIHWFHLKQFLRPQLATSEAEH